MDGQQLRRAFVIEFFDAERGLWFEWHEYATLIEAGNALEHLEALRPSSRIRLVQRTVLIPKEGD
jgi:hypothetical protein